MPDMTPLAHRFYLREIERLIQSYRPQPRAVWLAWALLLADVAAIARPDLLLGIRRVTLPSRNLCQASPGSASRPKGEGQMVDWLTLGALALASGINSAIPGPCVALTLARSSRGGALAGLAVVGGILFAEAGMVGMALAAFVGLLEISADLVSGLRWPAAAIMIAMGLRMLATSLQAGRGTEAARPTGAAGHFCAGMLVSVASPYNLIFLLALLPLYLPVASLTGTAVLFVVIALLAGAALAYLCAIALGAGSSRLIGAGTRWIERAGALCLIGFGVLAVTAHLG
jgi:threonine/homoserine/homoserine lactone efflux protein